MTDARPRPPWVDPETWQWLCELADDSFGGDVGAAAGSVLRAMRLTEWKPNRVDPPTDRWEKPRG